MAKHLFNVSRLYELLRKETVVTLREDVMLSAIVCPDTSRIRFVKRLSARQWQFLRAFYIVQVDDCFIVLPTSRHKLRLSGMICGAVLGERLVATFGLEVRWCFMPVAPLVAVAICVHESELHIACYSPATDSH